MLGLLHGNSAQDAQQHVVHLGGSPSGGNVPVLLWGHTGSARSLCLAVIRVMHADG